ncbi:aminopeptidase [Algibacter mikhailovii]|uniref:Aminopeptidase n=2 Tax=Algibacter mikhailovii TaxID=425498 RepID=A0A918QRM0_9FLAO|nr:aminopeptidase [Algibacter mikhailovii]
MLKHITARHERFSKTLMETMFQIKPGETVAITADFGTDTAIIDALFMATQNAGGLPIILRIPKAENDSQAGMKDWPSKAITAALCQADVWIEANSVVLLYSDIWETAMKNNKKLRYLIIADSSIESLDRVFTGFDIQKLKKFLVKIISLLKSTHHIRITSQNGTDVTYELNPNYLLDYDDGDFSKPKFGTAPGFVNIVPKIGSMNGTIVFEHLQHAEAFNNLRFIMKNGSISDVQGSKGAEDFKAYLSTFDDENMYKVSHNMLGFNPKINKITGELVEDERIWGGVDFGFGHTSPMDMPPFGQQAKSHFDGVVAKTSIYFDDVQITDNGAVCHSELKALANTLITDN